MEIYLVLGTGGTGYCSMLYFSEAFIDNNHYTLYRVN